MPSSPDNFNREDLLYFRIIVGGGIRDCVVPDSVNVFKFDEEYSLKQTLVSMI